MRTSVPDAETLAARLDELADAWRHDPDIASVWLFGSRAGGRPRPWSDVDLAVMLSSRLDRTHRGRKQLDLIADACRRLGTDAVDLVVVEDVPSTLAQRIVARGRRMLVVDERRTAAIVEDVLRRFIDEAPLRAALDAGLSARIREGRYAG